MFFVCNCFSYQYDLSICTIFRDEAPYLKEWIEYHRLLGVQHFYLCNHVSQDNYLEVLDPYIKKGIVELTESSIGNVDFYHFCFGVQIGWFNHCISKAKDESKWIAFIDSDEFLNLVQGNSLVEFLKDYEEFGALGVNWLMFGTSNVEKIISDRLMIEQLLLCSHTDHFNTYIKSIVRADRATGFHSPHYSGFMPPYYLVNTDKQQILNDRTGYVQYNKLFINHYWTRDEDYLEYVKIPRQIMFGSTAETVRERNDEMNRNLDMSIQRFVPALRKRMGLD